MTMKKSPKSGRIQSLSSEARRSWVSNLQRWLATSNIGPTESASFLKYTGTLQLKTKYKLLLHSALRRGVNIFESQGYEVDTKLYNFSCDDFGNTHKFN